MCEQLPMFAPICFEHNIPFVVFLFLKIRPTEWHCGAVLCYWFSEGEIPMGRAY